MTGLRRPALIGAWPFYTPRYERLGHVAKIDAALFYHLGATIVPLTHPRSPTATVGDLLDMVVARPFLLWFVSAEQRAIPVSSSCLDAGKALIFAIDALFGPVVLSKDVTDAKALRAEPHLVYNITTAAATFASILRSEISELETYLFAEAGTHSVAKLLRRAEATFMGLEGELPPEVVSEIREWGKCVAYELPTAAGFHILRATELMIIHYLDRVSPGITASILDPSWKTYIDALRRAKCADTITSSLHQIRNLYRNRVIHPEEILTAPQSEAISGVAKAAIYSLVTDLRTRVTLPASSGQPQIEDRAATTGDQLRLPPSQESDPSATRASE